MASPDIHVEWRMRVGRRVTLPYVRNPKVASVVIAGSVARGLADRYSDLEIDVYWNEPPTDSDRHAAIEDSGAQVMQFWDYSEEDEEWAEEYVVDGLWVGLSHFLTTTVDRFLHDVVDCGDPSDAKQMRISAIRDGIALSGVDLVGRWRAAIEPYPDALVYAMVRRHLHVDVLDGWHMRHALVERGDLLLLHGLMVRLEHAVLGTLLGLNRVYLSHTGLKWQEALVGALTVAPADLDRRLAEVFLARPRAGIEELEGLLAETLDLVADRLADLDLSVPRQLVARERPPLDPIH